MAGETTPGQAGTPQVQFTDLDRAIAVLSLDAKLIPPAVAVEMINEAKNGGRPVVEALLERVPEHRILPVIARELGVKYYDMHAPDSDLSLEDKILRRCEVSTLTQHSAIPLVSRAGNIVVAMANPTDVEMRDYLTNRFPESFEVVMASQEQIQSQLLYVDEPVVADNAQQNQGNRNPVVEWVDTILVRAVAEGASDIHLRFNADKSLNVRLRVDGRLRTIPCPLRTRELEVIGTILSKTEMMDAANLLDPQDGTFTFAAAGRPIDARVVMLPQAYGPSVVIRLLDSNNVRRRLEEMGFAVGTMETFRQAMALNQGMVLVCGPTGSGKTTTSYALLREIDPLERNIVTVEDPIEYRLPNIGQTQVRADRGDRSLTFTKALRTILRADPDVILIGEIRDEETAKVASEASITGHLVLSTVHASSAIGIYTRLIEMGVPSYMVADALSVSISQRLLRRVHDCAEMAEPDETERELLARYGRSDITQVPHPVGCGACANTGFRGRLAVVETLVPSRKFKNLVAAGASYEDLAAEADNIGFRPIVQDGLRLVSEGRATVADAVRLAVEL